jgi:class 3 adenylate cyclase
MSGNVTSFPGKRRRPAEQPGSGPGPGPLAAPELSAEPGEGYAVLSMELRREPLAGSELTPEIAQKVANRCVLATMEVLSTSGAALFLGGTPIRPVIEARFDGEDGASRAVQAILAVRDAVIRAQRKGESEFHLSAAVAAGRESLTPEGVRVTWRRPESVAVRLREEAAPGQVLLSAEAWSACEDIVDVVPGPSVTMVPDAPPVETCVLRGTRSGPS